VSSVKKEINLNILCTDNIENEFFEKVLEKMRKYDIIKQKFVNSGGKNENQT